VQQRGRRRPAGQPGGVPQGPFTADAPTRWKGRHKGGQSLPGPSTRHELGPRWQVSRAKGRVQCYSIEGFVVPLLPGQVAAAGVWHSPEPGAGAYIFPNSGRVPGQTSQWYKPGQLGQNVAA
jgi:hypothetical protein